MKIHGYEEGDDPPCDSTQVDEEDDTEYLAIVLSRLVRIALVARVTRLQDLHQALQRFFNADVDDYGSLLDQHQQIRETTFQWKELIRPAS